MALVAIVLAFIGVGIGVAGMVKADIAQEQAEVAVELAIRARTESIERKGK